jgi:hypothetical protein
VGIPVAGILTDTGLEIFTKKLAGILTDICRNLYATLY